jgi:transposase
LLRTWLAPAGGTRPNSASNHPEIQTRDVAHALDIHPFRLSKWKKDYREGRLKPTAVVVRDAT